MTEIGAQPTPNPDPTTRVDCRTAGLAGLLSAEKAERQRPLQGRGRSIVGQPLLALSAPIQDPTAYRLTVRRTRTPHRLDVPCDPDLTVHGVKTQVDQGPVPLPAAHIAHQL